MNDEVKFTLIICATIIVCMAMFSSCAIQVM